MKLIGGVEMSIFALEADILLWQGMQIGWMLRQRRMMAFSPPQPEGQVVDREAAYDD